MRVDDKTNLSIRNKEVENKCAESLFQRSIRVPMYETLLAENVHVYFRPVLLFL